MSKIKTIPKKDMYVLLLDDAKEDSYRFSWFEDFSNEHGQPKKCNLLTTRMIEQFIDYADTNRDVLMFIDPGELGGVGIHGKEYKEDRELFKWLEDNPSRVINVLFTIPKNNYGDIQTFTLKHQINDINYDNAKFFVGLLLLEWLFKNNPLALFGKDVIGWQQVTDYIPKLHEPLVLAICEQLGINGKGVAGKKKAISEYYHNTWKMEMKRRGVKGY
jgi:hypothetical protein